MPEQARKMSEILKEMSETLLRNPSGVPSSEGSRPFSEGGLSSSGRMA
jgi:hypothetical protein